MSKRRMFSQDIIHNDVFLDMPDSSQLLYFHLSMLADDYGFVSPKKVMRMVGASDDDLNILIAKRYVLQFPSGVVVIKHWHLNNTIRHDRSHKTTFEDEFNSLIFNEYGAYTELEKLGEFASSFNITTPQKVEKTTDKIEDTSVNNQNASMSQPNDNQMATENRLDKNRLDKNRDTKVSSTAGEPAVPKKAKTSEIDYLFGYWEKTVGYAVTQNVKGNREYLGKIIRENSMENIEKMVSGVAMSHADQYAPRISNFIQLYRKWDDLKAWGRRTQQTMNVNKGRNVKL